MNGSLSVQKPSPRLRGPPLTLFPWSITRCCPVYGPNGRHVRRIAFLLCAATMEPSQVQLSAPVSRVTRQLVFKALRENLPVLLVCVCVCVYNSECDVPDRGPVTAGHHHRLRQTGLAPFPAQIFHPGTQQGDRHETGWAVLRLHLLRRRQLRGELRGS